MEVYIESVLLNNALFDFCVLGIADKVRGNEVNMARRIWASVFGAVYGTISVLKPMIFLQTPLAVAICSVAIVFIATEHCTAQKAVLNTIAFWLTSIALGGVLYAAASVFAPVNRFGGLILLQTPPVWLLLSVPLLLNKTISLFLCLQKRKAFGMASNTNISIPSVHGNKMTVSALVDTGSTLVDPVTGKPIVLLATDIFKKIRREKEQSITVEFQTAAGNGVLDAYAVEPVYVESTKRLISVYAAELPNLHASYQAIIPAFALL